MHATISVNWPRGGVHTVGPQEGIRLIILKELHSQVLEGEIFIQWQIIIDDFYWIFVKCYLIDSFKECLLGTFLGH